MSKNTESYLRYLKTFLNNNKYNFNIAKVDDYINIPLFEYLNTTLVSNNTFTIQNVESELILNPPNKDDLNSLYLNPLISINDDLSESFLIHRKEYLSNNKNSIVNKDIFNKFNYLLKKKLNSKAEKSILITYGQLAFDIGDESCSFPIILQSINIEKNDDIIIAYKDLPIINFEAIREIPNISVKSLNLIKELSSTMNEVIKDSSEAKALLLSIFEALQYTSCNNLNILSSTNIVLTDKYLPIDTLINHTLRSDLSESNALDKLLGDFNTSNDKCTFTNTEFYSTRFKDKLLPLLENDISFINKRHNNHNNGFLMKVFSVVSKRYNSVAYVSSDKSHLDKLVENFIELSKSSTNENKNDIVERLERVESRFNRIIENLKADLNSFNNSNPYILEESRVNHKFHKIKAPYGEFWQKGVVYEKIKLKQLYDDLESVLIEEFYRFPWSIEVAELCKNKGELALWKEFLINIENYFLFKEKLTNHEDVKVEFKLKYAQYPLSVLDEILEYLDSNNKIPSFGIGVKASWKTFIREVVVKGEIPQTLEDFKIVEAHLKLNISKNRLVDLWSSLMNKTGFIKLDPSESLFEKKLNSYYQPLKNSIQWFENVWQPFFTKLLSTGFIWQRFLTEYMNIYIEKGLVKMLLDGGLKELSKLIKNQLSKENLDEDIYESKFNLPESDFLSLDNYKSMLEKIRIEDEKIISRLLSEYKKSLNFFSLNDFYDDIINNSSKYDLLIIDDCENLSMNELVLLAHCEKVVIIGDKNYTHFTSNTTFDNYSKVFNALLPDLDHSTFSGNNSLAKVVHKLTKNACNVISINSINPKINTLNNNIYDIELSFSNSPQSSPLYSGVGLIDLDYIDDIVIKLKSAFINQGLAGESFIIFVNSKKSSPVDRLKTQILNDFNNLDLPVFFVIDKLTEVKNYITDYLIILDANDTDEINEKALYNFSVSSKKQLAYITNNKQNLSIVNLIKEISQSEISNYPVAKDYFYNKDIYALDNLDYAGLLIDLMVYDSDAKVFLNDNTVVNNNIIDLITYFSCKVFHKNDSKSMENYAKSLSSFDKKDVLFAFAEEFLDISIKRKRELVEANIDNADNAEDFVDDIFTRSYIVTEDNKDTFKKIEERPSKGEIQVEDLSEVPNDNDIVKTEQSFELKTTEEDEFLPSSKFNKTISLNTKDDIDKSSGNNDFNIIQWLEEKDIPYYDYRPSGDLWIADSTKTRIELKELKEEGFSFSLCFRCEKLPNRINAWKFEV